MPQSQGRDRPWVERRREERRLERELSGAKPPRPPLRSDLGEGLALRHRLVLPILVRVARLSAKPPWRGVIRLRARAMSVDAQLLADTRARIDEAGRENLLERVVQIACADSPPTPEEVEELGLLLELLTRAARL